MLRGIVCLRLLVQGLVEWVQGDHRSHQRQGACQVVGCVVLDDRRIHGQEQDELSLLGSLGTVELDRWRSHPASALLEVEMTLDKLVHTAHLADMGFLDRNMGLAQ